VSKIWFITGSSRGFGRALVEAVLVAGDKVVATARKPQDLADLSESYRDQVRAVKMDVTSPAEVVRAVAAAVEAFGHIDVVVNNAGYGFFGAFRRAARRSSQGGRRDPEDRPARGASASHSIGHRRDGLPSRRLQDHRGGTGALV
jgi:NAD(P)-dependent dehydrogenase (short-subunit alcohol dehydrogenase family)